MYRPARFRYDGLVDGNGQAIGGLNSQIVQHVFDGTGFAKKMVLVVYSYFHV